MLKHTEARIKNERISVRHGKTMRNISAEMRYLSLNNEQTSYTEKKEKLQMISLFALYVFRDQSGSR